MGRLTQEEFKTLMANHTNVRQVCIVPDQYERTLKDALRSGGQWESAAPSNGPKVSTWYCRFSKSYFSDYLGQFIRQKTTGTDFLVNVVDRASAKGAFIVVNCMSGVSAEAESQLKEILAKNIRPAVFVDGLDEAIMKGQLSKEDLFQNLSSLIDRINTIIEQSPEAQSNFQPGVFPTDGTVAFGSISGWALTLESFARRHSVAYGLSVPKMMERLWGDSFYSSKTRKWHRSPPDGMSANDTRAFNTAILGTLYGIWSVVQSGDWGKLDDISKKLDIRLSVEDKMQSEKDLFSTVMQKYLPAADNLFFMAITGLPSQSSAEP